MEHCEEATVNQITVQCGDQINVGPSSNYSLILIHVNLLANTEEAILNQITMCIVMPC